MQSSCATSLGGLRVRLHGLKIRRKKRGPVLPLVQHSSPACGKEGRVRHAKKTKYRPQIRLHEIERGHLRLGVVDPARCDDESRLLADKQALRPFLPVGKGSADSRNLVDPQLEHGGEAKVMHRNSDDVIITLL